MNLLDVFLVNMPCGELQRGMIVARRGIQTPRKAFDEIAAVDGTMVNNRVIHWASGATSQLYGTAILVAANQHGEPVDRDGNVIASAASAS